MSKVSSLCGHAVWRKEGFCTLALSVCSKITLTSQSLDSAAEEQTSQHKKKDENTLGDAFREPPTFKNLWGKHEVDELYSWEIKQTSKHSKY